MAAEFPITLRFLLGRINITVSINTVIHLIQIYPSLMFFRSKEKVQIIICIGMCSIFIQKYQYFRIMILYKRYNRTMVVICSSIGTNNSYTSTITSNNSTVWILLILFQIKLFHIICFFDFKSTTALLTLGLYLYAW